MAGSISWFEYTTDAGTRAALKVDKSNGAAVTSTGKTLMLPRATATAGALPGNIKKRYVYAYSSANPRIRRRFWIGNPLAIPDILISSTTITAEDYPAGDDKAGVAKTWIITAYRGEKASGIPAVAAPDTGLTDT
jgi:hypothetical protein